MLTVTRPFLPPEVVRNCTMRAVPRAYRPDGAPNNGDAGETAARGSPGSRTVPTTCFDAREVTVIQLGTGSYDVTVEVTPHSSFGQTTRTTLRSLDPASVPAISGSRVDSIAFQLGARRELAGVATGQLPNNANMRITDNAMRRSTRPRCRPCGSRGASWMNVDTVTDPVPDNPYVPATLNRAATHALIQC